MQSLIRRIKVILKSVSFPIMFNNTSTKIVEDNQATLQNLKLLLLSDRGALFGDPYYGTIIKRLVFDQNNVILRDIVSDAIYTAILQFMPQIKVNRKDITIAQSGSKIDVNIKATNMVDFQTDLYNLTLINGDKED